MVTNPKVGDKYWIIFVQHDGSCNNEFLAIARATVTFVEDTWPNDKGLGPYCLCAVIQKDNHIFFAPQKVRAYHMYNTWDEAMKALESVLTWGIFKLRQHKEQITAEVQKKLSEIDASEQDIKNTVEEFLADQCTMINIQEPFESPKEEALENTGKPEEAANE